MGLGVLTRRRLKQLSSPDAEWPRVGMAYAAGVAPLFYTTVRGWTNAALVVLLLFSIRALVLDPQLPRRLWSDTRVRWIVLALVSPLLAALFNHVARLQFQPGDYDGPLRPVAGAIILFGLIAARVNFVRIFQWTCPLSLVVCAMALWINPAPTQFWAMRWATYFVDPLTFGQYALLFGACSLMMINLVEKDRPILVLLKIVGFCAGIALSIGSGSRSAWVALPALFIVWLAFGRNNRPWAKLAGGLAAVALIGLFAYVFIEPFHARVDITFADYRSYFDGGNRDTSGGLRLSLIRAAWQLFLLEPWHGYAAHGLPPLQSIEEISSFYTPKLEFTITNHGTHNELMQKMLRFGVFGFASTVLVFGVPFALFWSAARSAVRDVAAAGVVGLAYIVGVFCFGLSTEAFALKFLYSFYAVMISALAAQIIWCTPRSPGIPSQACGGGDQRDVIENRCA